LFHVRESGHRLSLGQVLTITQLGVSKKRDSVAEYSRDFPGFIELDDFLLQPCRLVEGEHGSLAASNYDGVEVSSIEVRDFLRVLNQGSELRCGDETHTHQVGLRISTRIARIAHGICLALASVGTENLHFVALFLKRKVGMAQFAPPEAHWPARGR